MSKFATCLVVGFYFCLTNYCFCAALLTGPELVAPSLTDRTCHESPSESCDDHHDQKSSNVPETCCIQVDAEKPVVLSSQPSMPSRGETIPILWLEISLDTILLDIQKYRLIGGLDPPRRTGRPLRDSPESPRAPPFSA